MTITELLIGILWVIVGFWVAYKRKWYIKQKNDPDWPQELVIFLAVVLAPLFLIGAFVREMLIDDWNNNK
jgi:prolipoprotein diacylglyceryltransferase